MKKLNYLLITVLCLILIFIISTNVNAADGTVEDFGPEEIEIQSTTSTYTTGTTLTILVKRELAVQITDPPELIIQFGNGAEIELKCHTQPGSVNQLQYTYTIKSDDVGELKILKQQQKVENGVVSVSLANIKLTQTVIANESSSSGESETDSKWTDFSKATYEWSDYTETDHRSPSLTIKGVNLENTYYFYMSHNKNDNPDLSKLGEDLDYWKLISSNGKISATNLTSYLETNGDIYIWIAEVQNRESNIVVNAKKIERLEQLPLTKRIVGYFGDELAGGIFCYEPYTSTERKINIKIGKMTDNTILKKLKNNEVNGISDLLDYAKKTNALVEETFSFGDNPTIPTTVKLENGAYYYAYFELEDENEKYYPVEDVELYQASISENNVKLINRTDRNFVYNIQDNDNNNDDNNDNNVNDNTVSPDKLPQTGINTTVGIIIGVLIIITIGVAYKVVKYRDIK